jgi:beta-N-acetylhexosaminidase
MNLDQKIGQLFIIPAFGRYMSESSPQYRELVRHVRDNHVGGIIWFLSNVLETAWLNARLQELADVPLLVSADLEAGLGMRFPESTWWPTAMAIAATGEAAYAEQQGRVTAREAKLLGVDHILAPVCDVNVDPDNPVINTRSFGEDPHAVARYVAAFVRGVQDEGALATAKHFPGHGDTHVDSHRSLPMLSVDRERLDRVELVPFRAAIEAGVGSVMIGHLAVPSLDATRAPIREFHRNAYGTTEGEIPRDGTIPATVSRTIIRDLLRRDLGFEGLVVTDAFDMGGLVAHFDAGEAAVRAIEAGQDQIMYSENTDLAIAGVREAVRSGRIAESRIDESVERILAAKKRVDPRVAPFEEIFRRVDSAEHREIAQEIARRAITLVRDDRGLLPLRESRVTAVVVSDIPEFEQPLADALRELQPSRAFALDVRSPESDADAIDGDLIVMLLAVRAKSGAGRIAVPPAAQRLAERHGAKTIAVSFGSPYILRSIPDVSTYICAYGIQPVLQRAAVRALRGAEMTGRLPVTI